jgi:hypothetical protein
MAGGPRQRGRVEFDGDHAAIVGEEPLDQRAADAVASSGH